MLGRQTQNAQMERRPFEDIEGFDGGSLSCRISVEAQDHLVRDPLDQRRVFQRKGGAQRCGGISEAVLPERRRVHITLDEEQISALADKLPRPVQIVQLLTLLKNGCFGGIQIFRSLVGIRPGAPPETDQPVLVVLNREHDPISETVVDPAVLPSDRKSRRFDISLGKALAQQRARQLLPAVRRQADPEIADRFVVHAAPLQIIPGVCRPLKILEIVVCGESVHFVNGLFLIVGPSVVLALLLGLGQRDPGSFREKAHRFGKRQILDLHDKVDKRTAFSAAEAVIQLFLTAYGKRRGLFGMKRTAAHKLAALLL